MPLRGSGPHRIRSPAGGDTVAFPLPDTPAKRHTRIATFRGTTHRAAAVWFNPAEMTAGGPGTERFAALTPG